MVAMTYILIGVGVVAASAVIVILVALSLEQMIQAYREGRPL